MVYQTTQQQIIRFKERIYIQMENNVSKRMLTQKEAQEYLGLKQAKCREFGEQINCIRRIGRRVLYDKFIIDKALDNLDKA